MTRRKLSSKIRLNLIYQDNTEFGSAITGKCDATIRRYCHKIITHRHEFGLREVVARSRELLTNIMVPGLADLYERPGVLREDWLYPDPHEVKPIALQIERNIGEDIAVLELSTDLIAELALYLGEWEQGSHPPSSTMASELWNALSDYGALIEIDDLSQKLPRDHATFVGHSTLQLSDGKSSILFDPFLLPKSEIYPSNYQPLSLDELGKPDAVFITHSHPDHFDLGTLLRIGANTPIFLPHVERESVLAIDMVWRLSQLGFQNIHPIAWFSQVQVGGMRVIALPFYGEQPTVGEVLHPGVRNQGNIYLVEYCNHRVALTTDSGSDAGGNVKEVAGLALNRYGSLDTLFGGYRGFGLYPIQYLFSSVARYLPFVPEKSWQVRQKMMCDADDLIDVAEIWDAQRVIPYSDGGAPWFWLRGLGAVLDGTQGHIMNIDPPPDHVYTVANQRSGTLRDGAIASPVSICLLKPGDAIKFG